MTLIKWSYSNIMPWLGWYFFVVIIIGLIMTIIIRRSIRVNRDIDFMPVFLAMAPYIVGWLPFGLWLGWFKLHSIFYEREKRTAAAKRISDHQKEREQAVCPRMFNEDS